ncbi:MAG: LamG domain-containing protein, partial [Patescibacteria group bacterium]
GGPDAGLYESGSNLNLANFQRGLVGYWKMDEVSGTTADDSSGRNNNGNVAGAITRRSGSECVNQNCVETALGGNITIPYNPSLNLTTNVTYAHWIKIKTAVPASSWPYSLGNDSHRYIALRSSSNGASWMFEYGRNNPTCDGNSFTGTGSGSMGTNTWHYLAMTYDGSNIKIYLDGALASNNNFSLGFCNNPSSSYYIAQGSASPGVYLVDDARIYNRALSATEISAIYNATK